MSAVPTVLVVSARSDDRGRRAATRAAAALDGLAETRVADRAELPALLSAADHVVVLDPARWRAALTTHPVLDAPGRAAARLALLRVLREVSGRVRWVGRPDQWEGVRDVLVARAVTTTALRS